MPDLASWLTELVRATPFGPLYQLRTRPRPQPPTTNEAR